MDSNPHRKPYDEETRKYWRDWYNAMNPEEKKEFNRKRYLRAKALKAERESKKKPKDVVLDVVSSAADAETPVEE